MTPAKQPDPATSGPTAAKRPGKRVGAVLSGTVLVIGNLTALVETVISWLITPFGIGDTSGIEGAWFTAALGIVLALFTALLTLIPIKARWLGIQWLIIPAVVFVVAMARWTYIHATYF